MVVARYEKQFFVGVALMVKGQTNPPSCDDEEENKSPEKIDSANEMKVQ